MRQSVLPRGEDYYLKYASPWCMEIWIESQFGLCTSDTEPVDEEDGEW